MLTGKAKEEFEKWYLNFGDWRFDKFIKINEGGIDSLKLSFYRQHISMQIGVYQLFFDSVGIQITIHDKFSKPAEWGCKLNQMLPIGIKNKHFTRPEAWKEAIKKANEIFNKR